ncbi:unnamed protein product [Phytophthora fragariaefolia]|uniref:Unnamed protein product n=1 Tax=Phytophthora fragariaefolia TaxID=1490495 RepID=A0A9W7CK76_9STRA|nr:unnamed protein product [Phytophthora fragariaefolia]
MKKRSVVFVLIDGLADVSLRELDQQTPLEAAQTPAMDAIARSFEAMGAGLPMSKGDVAFKCNFATVEKNEDGQLIVERRRVDRNFPSWGIELCSFLDGLTLPEFPGLVVATKYATEHRCGIVFKGPGLCDKMTGTDPLKDHLPLVTSEPLNDTPDAAYSSKVLNAVSTAIHERLSSHPINKAREAENKPPANVVLLRGPGERIDVPTFTEMHGLNPFMIAPTCIIAGLGMSLGFEIATAPGATGDYHTNLRSKAETALKLLRGGEFDFGFVHVKAVDDAGHDRDVAKKVYFIERADEMISMLLDGIHAESGEEDDEVTIVVTGDHTTPVKYGDHTFEPVPFAIARAGTAYKRLQHFKTAGNSPSVNGSSPAALTDEVTQFSEMAVARGALGRFAGDQVMKLVKGFRERFEEERNGEEHLYDKIMELSVHAEYNPPFTFGWRFQTARAQAGAPGGAPLPADPIGLPAALTVQNFKEAVLDYARIQGALARLDTTCFPCSLAQFGQVTCILARLDVNTWIQRIIAVGGPYALPIACVYVPRPRLYTLDRATPQLPNSLWG